MADGPAYPWYSRSNKLNRTCGNIFNTSSLHTYLRWHNILSLQNTRSSEISMFQCYVNHIFIIIVQILLIAIILVECNNHKSLFLLLLLSKTETYLTCQYLRQRLASNLHIWDAGTRNYFAFSLKKKGKGGFSIIEVVCSQVSFYINVSINKAVYTAVGSVSASLHPGSLMANYDNPIKHAPRFLPCQLSER